MSEPAVFVTGATGIVGSAVVQHLLNRNVQVLAAVRSVTDAATLPVKATVRRFDFDSTPAELTAALIGADRLFLMRPPPLENVARYLFPLIDAVKDAPVNKSVLYGFGSIVALWPLVQRLRRLCGASSIRCCRIWMTLEV